MIRVFLRICLRIHKYTHTLPFWLFEYHWYTQNKKYVYGQWTKRCNILDENLIFLNYCPKNVLFYLICIYCTQNYDLLPETKKIIYEISKNLRVPNFRPQLYIQYECKRR